MNIINLIKYIMEETTPEVESEVTASEPVEELGEVTGTEEVTK